MAEWLDYPAQEVAYSGEVVANIPIADMPTISQVSALDPLTEIIVLPEHIDWGGIDLRELASFLDSSLGDYLTIPPGQAFIELDYSSAPLIEGVEILPVILIPIGCNTDPYQFWG